MPCKMESGSCRYRCSRIHTYFTSFILYSYNITCGGDTNFPKIQEPSLYSRHQKGTTKRAPCSQPTNIRHNYTRYSCPCYLVPEICVPSVTVLCYFIADKWMLDEFKLQKFYRIYNLIFILFQLQ
jgi:hypothetical protein